MTGISLMIVGGTYALPIPPDQEFGWLGFSNANVERIEYSNDSHSIRGNMSASRYAYAATGGFPG
jgi:hypothetical protein